LFSLSLCSVAAAACYLIPKCSALKNTKPTDVLNTDIQSTLKQKDDRIAYEVEQRLLACKKLRRYRAEAIRAKKRLRELETQTITQPVDK